MDKVRARDPLNQPPKFDKLKNITSLIPFPALLEWKHLSGFTSRLFVWWWKEWPDHLANKLVVYYCKKIFPKYDPNNEVKKALILIAPKFYPCFFVLSSPFCITKKNLITKLSLWAMPNDRLTMVRQLLHQSWESMPYLYLLFSRALLRSGNSSYPPRTHIRGRRGNCMLDQHQGYSFHILFISFKYTFFLLNLLLL